MDEYDVVPLHRKPELIDDCCKLLNSEWPRSKTARLKSLNVSCDSFPTCLILIAGENKVLGHCKISLIPWLNHSCFMESVIIDYHSRSQGLGSKLLRKAEEYILRKGIRNIYLITKGQEEFYFKNGYDSCDPSMIYGIANFVISPSTASTRAKKFKEKMLQFSGPPPPPMPTLQIPKVFDVRMLSRKTHMVKKL